MKKMLLIAVTVLTLTPISAPAAVYSIDPAHSTVGFRIRHLAGHVNGQFDRFVGDFTYVPGTPAVWKASATIETASIDTRNERRDHHLRTGDFFDADKFSAISFVSQKIFGVKGDHATMTGLLTIHGVTKPVALDVEIGGVAEDASGAERAAFSAKGKIDRRDFGIDWNNPLAGGKLMLGDEVEINLDVEGVKSEAK